jgi:glucose/arabinose dehydrogenase
MARFALALLFAAIVTATTASAQATFDSASTRFVATEIASGLQQPVALAFLPDRRALLVQRQSAQLSLVDRSGHVTAIAEEPEAVARQAVLTGEDAGLLDVVLHPDYARTGWIYLSYSSGERERRTTAVDRLRLRDGRIAERTRIFSANAWSEDRFHYGGRMVFAGGLLYVTVGDRHHQDRAQELDNHAGKILRLTEDGGAAADNPLAAQSGALPEIWSYGHRNPQGLFFDAPSGTLWSHEHGPRHGDELNLIRAGANYGWPVISYGWQYAGGPIGQGITFQDGMQQPLWVWTPSIAPSGLVRYTGTAFAAWRGNLLLGAMAQRSLVRLVLRDNRVVLEERLMPQQAGRVRLVAQGPDGEIYLGNDDGKLLRLTPAR